MWNVGFGDVVFIILVLGIIHGIMYLVALSRNRKSESRDDPDRQ